MKAAWLRHTGVLVVHLFFWCEFTLVSCVSLSWLLAKVWRSILLELLIVGLLVGIETLLLVWIPVKRLLHHLVVVHFWRHLLIVTNDAFRSWLFYILLHNLLLPFWGLEALVCVILLHILLSLVVVNLLVLILNVVVDFCISGYFWSLGVNHLLLVRVFELCLVFRERSLHYWLLGERGLIMIWDWVCGIKTVIGLLIGELSLLILLTLIILLEALVI
jgi:hypothetical protein